MDEQNNIFTNDIFEKIKPRNSTNFSLIETALPTAQDMYFVAKWHEIFERYQSARLFLRQTQEEKYDYWFEPVDNQIDQKGIELTIKGELFESALISYNILVDLSWAWTYVSAEYVLYTFDKDGNITNAQDICEMHPIEEAYKLLRKTENNTLSPHAESNPFDYIKIMRPEFTDAINTITEFWREFSNSDIHNLYNFIKHKGKPRYSEIEDLRKGKFFNLIIKNQTYPTDIREVQRIVSLNESIQDLITFDNKRLFPYLHKLLDELKIAVNPSPMVF